MPIGCRIRHNLRHRTAADSADLTKGEVAVNQVRQGDVLLERVQEIPAGAVKVVPGSRGHVLAEGEATGHAHTIAAEFGELYEKDGVLYLSITEDAPLTHQEHGTITLPPSFYRKIQQREWTDQDEPRAVLD